MMQASTLARIKRPGARVDWLTTSSDIRSRQICRKRKRGRNRSRCFDNAVERRKGGDKRKDRKAGTTLRLIFHYFYFSPSGKRGAALIRHAGARPLLRLLRRLRPREYALSPESTCVREERGEGER